MNREEQIEKLRAEMINKVIEKNSFIDDTVVAISQQLDKLINQFQQQMVMQNRLKRR